VYYYLIRFTGESPFSHSALDIKTYAMAMLKKDYRASVKRNMPRRWYDYLPHTHQALDDAIEQGALFCNMLNERLKADQCTGNRSSNNSAPTGLSTAAKNRCADGLRISLLTTNSSTPARCSSAT